MPAATMFLQIVLKVVKKSDFQSKRFIPNDFLYILISFTSHARKKYVTFFIK